MEKLQYLKEKAALSVIGLRSAIYFAESLPLPYIDALLTKRNLKVETPSSEVRTKIINEMTRLLEDDARHIADGIYPWRVLMPENPAKHVRRLGKILWDTVELSLRKKEKDHASFSREAAEYLDDVPDYYRRNFHFQKDGYLSARSADIYEHQVEMLFRGLAGPMRRLVLPPMKRHFRMSKGRGLHFLEVAAGAGTLTRYLALTFPEAKVTVLDLSFPYLKKAQDNLNSFKRIEYVQGDAGNTPFKDEQFDAVVSSFLFHELPLAERENVLRECSRLTKPGGFICHVDSVQEGDQPGLDWALERFPQEFHEPFYKNYVKNPMEQLWKDTIGIDPFKQIGFYSKVLWSRRPESKVISNPESESPL